MGDRELEREEERERVGWGERERGGVGDRELEREEERE